MSEKTVLRPIMQSGASGHLQSESGRLRLTEHDEKWAVQVIRAHRLWETWLAAFWFLSRTILKGEASAFTLELPPYRRPSILRILYTSLIDRTVFVLWRAMLTATPAGAVIWVVGNINAGGTSLARHAANFLQPLGFAIGLDGVILLAYVIAIPANEIVVPTMLMV